VNAPVNQLHISLVPAQDRLLLRVATANRRELRLWMTRRFVKVLWPMLLESLQADPAVAGQTDPYARKEVLSFQHHQAVQDTEFTAEYKAPPRTRPLTQTPLLLTRARCSAEGPDLTRVELITARDRSFQLTLDRTTIHSLCKLIADCAGKAKWDLDLSLAEPGDAPAHAERTIN
jgi:hypothetical protein